MNGRVSDKDMIKLDFCSFYIVVILLELQRLSRNFANLLRDYGERKFFMHWFYELKPLLNTPLYMYRLRLSTLKTHKLDMKNT